MNCSRYLSIGFFQLLFFATMATSNSFAFYPHLCPEFLKRVVKFTPHTDESYSQSINKISKINKLAKVFPESVFYNLQPNTQTQIIQATEVEGISEILSLLNASKSFVDHYDSNLRSHDFFKYSESGMDDFLFRFLKPLQKSLESAHQLAHGSFEFFTLGGNIPEWLSDGSVFNEYEITERYIKKNPKAVFNLKMDFFLYRIGETPKLLITTSATNRVKYQIGDPLYFAQLPNLGSSQLSDAFKLLASNDILDRFTAYDRLSQAESPADLDFLLYALAGNFELGNDFLDSNVSSLGKNYSEAIEELSRKYFRTLQELALKLLKFNDFNPNLSMDIIKSLNSYSLNIDNQYNFLELQTLYKLLNKSEPIALMDWLVKNSAKFLNSTNNGFLIREYTELFLTLSEYIYKRDSSSERVSSLSNFCAAMIRLLEGRLDLKDQNISIFQKNQVRQSVLLMNAWAVSLSKSHSLYENMIGSGSFNPLTLNSLINSIEDEYVELRKSPERNFLEVRIVLQKIISNIRTLDHDTDKPMITILPSLWVGRSDLKELLKDYMSEFESTEVHTSLKTAFERMGRLSMTRQRVVLFTVIPLLHKIMLKNESLFKRSNNGTFLMWLNKQLAVSNNY